MERDTDRQTHTQNETDTDWARDRQTWRQTGGETETGKHTDWLEETCRQAGRETQADTQTDTERHRQADRQTHRKTQSNTVTGWLTDRHGETQTSERHRQSRTQTDRLTHMERHRYIDGHMERDTDRQTDWKTETKRTSQRQRHSKAQWQKQSYMEKRGWGRHKDTICRQKNRSQTGNPWLGACTTILQHPTSVCQHRPTHQLYVGLQKPEVLVAVTHVVNHVFVQHAQQGFHHSIKCLVSLKQITVSHTTMRSTSSSRTSSCCPAKLKVGVDWEEVGEARKGGRPSLEGKKAESIKK